MTRQRIHIVLYLKASEAETLIDLLTELRDNLWAGYGDDIIEMRQARENLDLNHNDGDLNDDIVF